MLSLLTHVEPNLYDFMEHKMDIYNACMMFLVFILSFIVFLNFKMLCFTKKKKYIKSHWIGITWGVSKVRQNFHFWVN